MAAKLTRMELTSVDLVRRGANQEADICLFKSETPPDDNSSGSLQKNSPTGQNEPTDTPDKAGWYADTLYQSFCSIQEDESLDSVAKSDMMRTSLQQFDEAMKEYIGELHGKPVEKAAPRIDCIEDVNVKKKRIDCVTDVNKGNPWHDPATGRFSSGPGGAVGGISSRTMTGGGISIHVKNCREPKTGYMVAAYGERSEWLQGDDVTDPAKRTKRIKDFMEKNKDLLSEPDNFLGTWLDPDTGFISLDISKCVSDKAKAMKFAEEHNEKAIWDIANMANIDTGGTGNNL